MKTKRIIKALIAIALTFTSLQKLSSPVFAQEKTNELPIEQFATMEELKTFDTNDQNGKNPAKVYFGNNDQQWWIAGSQNGNLTLFAASALISGQEFMPNGTVIETDASKWSDCDYQQDVVITGVYPNHYGASLVRDVLQNAISNDNTMYFSHLEQNLMIETTVYTGDEKYQNEIGKEGQKPEDLDKKSVYTTKDKLYLPYGEYTSGLNYHVTVGRNDISGNVSSISDLNNGLRVDRTYWKSDDFLLRTPNYGSQHSILAATNQSDGYITAFSYTSTGIPLKPAFELNLSSVLFASAVSSASTGNLVLQDTDGDGAFTLRYDASKYSKNLGTASVSYDYSEVVLKDVPSNTYLVVQNSNGAYAKIVSGNGTLIPTDISQDLTSFENCKVWLETTDTTNRITYATLAKEIPASAVAIVGNDYYSDVKDAINASSEQMPAVLIKDVIDSNSGSFWPKDGAVLNTNGYTLTFSNELASIILEPNINFTINGSGNMDKPDIVIGRIGINGTQEIDLNKGFYLNNVYIKKSKEWFTTLLSNNGHMILTNCKIDAYPVFGDITKKDDSLFVSGVTELYGNNTIIGDIKLFEQGTLAENGKLELIDGVIKGFINVPETLEGCVGDTLSTVTLPENWEWVNPNEIMNPTMYHELYFETKAKYYIQDDYDYSHYVGFNKEGNYVIEDVIIKLDRKNDWIIKPNIQSWTYGEEVSTPVGQSLYGTVEFSYKLENEDVYSTEVPTEPGNYVMRAFVDEQEINHETYREMETLVPFTIHKKIPTITLPNNIVAYEGDKLMDVSLPHGFTWKDGNQIVNYSGEYEAIYTPVDTNHYKTLEVKIWISMYDHSIMNNAPTIKVSDVTLTVGDTFDPIKDVSASDVDGDKVILEVIKNTVDTTKVGIYEVTYKATDSKGASSVKTIKVKVVETISDKEELEDMIKDNESKYDKGDYTEESYQDYLDALEKAKEVLNDKNATSEDIKEALDNLKDTIAGLEEKEIVSEVDKSQLEEKLDEYQMVNSKDYSKESYETFKKAYEEAYSILKDSNASREDVTSALNALENAYKSLQKEEASTPSTSDSYHISFYISVIMICGLVLGLCRRNYGVSTV